MEAMSSLCKSSSCITTSSDDDGVGELRRGPWTAEEDALLVHYISCNGEGRWNLLAKRSGLKRTGKSCRLRWLNYLRPDVKRGNLSPEEQLLILELYSKWGNRWSKIAQYLPGRTDNEIKNYWRTRVQKQARRLKMECNSTEFQKLIRNIWMPRLIQKAQLGYSNLLPDSSSVAPTQAPLYGLSDDHQTQTLYAATAENMGSSPSSMSSSDSTNISSMPHEYHQAFEFSENPIFPVSNNNLYEYDHSRNECCNVDSNNISCDIEILNSTSVAANVTATGGSIGPANFGSGHNNWLSDDMGFCLWNSLDEFWQLREIGSLNQSP